MITPKLFRILYVVKNEGDCQLLGALLDSSYIEITPARTVAEALQKIRTEHFNLFLLETRLPDGDGFKLCREMREIAPLTPIVFYSGDAGDDYRRRGIDAGANVYLAKPYLDSLTTTISEFIM